MKARKVSRIAWRARKEEPAAAKRPWLAKKETSQNDGTPLLQAVLRYRVASNDGHEGGPVSIGAICRRKCLMDSVSPIQNRGLMAQKAQKAHNCFQGSRGQSAEEWEPARQPKNILTL